MRSRVIRPPQCDVGAKSIEHLRYRLRAVHLNPRPLATERRPSGKHGAHWPADRTRQRQAAHAHDIRIGQKHRDKMRDPMADRKSTRLNSSHVEISYAVFCLKKKKQYK